MNLPPLFVNPYACTGMFLQSVPNYKEYTKIILTIAEEYTSLFKLKLKLTPFGIAHCSKGNPFQVCLTVSTCYLCKAATRKDELGVTHGSRRGGKL